MCVWRGRNNQQGGGKTKSLLIGINYIGQQGQLSGCHNDVDMMKKYITTHVRQADRQTTGRMGGRTYCATGFWMLDTISQVVARIVTP